MSPEAENASIPAMTGRERDRKFVRTEDGLELFARAWPAGGTGCLAILHGYGEHSGRYEAFARWLNGQGWDVIACDLRGHGRSPGRRGHIRRFSEYLQDAAALHAGARDLAPGRPVFLLGHSLGGLIAVHYTQEGGEDLAGLILSSPALRVAMPVAAWKRLSAPILSHLWPSFSAPSEIDPVWLSHDAGVVEAYRTDPLVHRVGTARWVTEMQAAQAAALHEARTLVFPLLVLQGGADRLTDPAATEKFFQAAGAKDKTFKSYEGFYHEPLNEVGKERVWEDVRIWLEAHLGGEKGRK